LKLRFPFALFPLVAEEISSPVRLQIRLTSGANASQTPRTISSPINQQLIAERLKLSRTTVSRSLANHPAISADTRAKVQSLAAKMGYRGNPSRTLR
jgi:hypothetical protein